MTRSSPAPSLRSTLVLVLGCSGALAAAGGCDGGGSGDPGGGDGAGSCLDSVVSGALDTGFGMIEFPEVASVVALTQADGVSQLSATATGLEDTGSGCFVAVTSQDTPFPASRVGVATLEFRGVTCPGIGPAAQQIFGRALDEPMSSHMTMDLVQDTSYVDVFGMGSECWTGTVSVEFSDHVIAPLDLSGMSSLDLRGTLTFTGGVLRAYNR